MARWLSEITEFNFKIKYTKAENMCHVDALSRAPVVTENIDESQESVSYYFPRMREYFKLHMFECI